MRLTRKIKLSPSTCPTLLVSIDVMTSRLTSVASAVPVPVPLSCSQGSPAPPTSPPKVSNPGVGIPVAHRRIDPRHRAAVGPTLARGRSDGQTSGWRNASAATTVGNVVAHCCCTKDERVETRRHASQSHAHTTSDGEKRSSRKPIELMSV